jgi:hypothetical protein
MLRHLPLEIVSASLVKFWILAKIARQALRHKAYPFFPCGRTRSTTPPQILTKGNRYLFTLNDLPFSLPRSCVIVFSKNDHKMYFCEILNSPQEPSHGTGWTMDLHHLICAKNATFLARRWGGRSADSVR